MNTQIFINLPVADLPKSLIFYKALGFTQNTDLSNDSGACVVISETIHLMLATHEKFTSFTPKKICDRDSTEVLLSLSCESRQQVDDLVAKALANGGHTNDEPQDYGFMYDHSFVDPDGHQWGLFHMSGVPPKN